jgi:hypothetical protein
MTPMPPYQPPMPPRTNGWAIGSLVCGLLGCFPIFLTALAAIVLGILGISKSKQPNTGGKGLAIAGLVLGVIGLLWSAGFIAVGMWGYNKANELVLKPGRQISSSFINDLSSGDTSSAKSLVGDNMSQEEINQLSQKIKSYGQLKDIHISGVNASGTGSRRSFTLEGTAEFQSATKAFSARFGGEVTDPSTYKIEDFNID